MRSAQLIKLRVVALATALTWAGVAASLYATAQAGEPSLSELPKKLAQFIEWELYSNPVNQQSLRGPVGFEMGHFEVPFKFVEAAWLKSIDPGILDSFVFTRNGEKYLRWIINPEDTQWTAQVEQFLKERGISTDRKKLFKAFKTSSRSMVILNPENGAVFSAKVSTDRTGGHWQNKRFSAGQARTALMATEAAAPLNQNSKATIKILEEPAIFVLEGLPPRLHTPSDHNPITAIAQDQGMVVRDLRPMLAKDRYSMPAFSALSSKTGREIAEKNGAKSSEEVAAFWRKHFIEPLGRASAEFTAQTGLTYDSPHGQNFLIELDERMHPTGKIVFRDFQDSFANAGFWRHARRPELLKAWTQTYATDRVESFFGPIYSNSSDFSRLPEWLSVADYQEWVSAYHASFESRFAELTGVPVETLNQVFQKPVSGLGYNLKRYPKEVLGAWYEKAEALQANRAEVIRNSVPSGVSISRLLTSQEYLHFAEQVPRGAERISFIERYSDEIVASRPDAQGVEWLLRETQSAGWGQHRLARGLLPRVPTLDVFQSLKFSKSFKRSSEYKTRAEELRRHERAMNPGCIRRALDWISPSNLVAVPTQEW